MCVAFSMRNIHIPLRCELYDMGELHVVDDVVLLGTPVTTEPSKWQKAQHGAASALRLALDLVNYII